MEIWELKMVMIGVKEKAPHITRVHSTNPELTPKAWPGFQ